jgi:opacity protein-like surface antigen
MFMSSPKILFFILISGGLLSQAFAAENPSNDSSWLVSVSAGALWVQAGESQTFYLTPEIEKTYDADQSTHALPSGEVFIGVQKPLASQWLGQLGLAVTANDNAGLEGVIWDDANPEFNNHRYDYQIQTTRVALKGKFLFDRGSALTPWVSLSVGAAFNRAHDYTNTPLIHEALPNNNFADQTTAAFSYSVGAGLQKSIGSHWLLAIGYEFSDWGQSELGRASDQSLNSGLTADHLYTNGLLFSLIFNS